MSATSIASAIGLTLFGLAVAVVIVLRAIDPKHVAQALNQ